MNATTEYILIEYRSISTLERAVNQKATQGYVLRSVSVGGSSANGLVYIAAMSRCVDAPKPTLSDAPKAPASPMVPSGDPCDSCPWKDGLKDAFGNPAVGDVPCQWCKHYKWRITYGANSYDKIVAYAAEHMTADQKKQMLKNAGILNEDGTVAEHYAEVFKYGKQD